MDNSANGGDSDTDTEMMYNHNIYHTRGASHTWLNKQPSWQSGGVEVVHFEGLSCIPADTVTSGAPYLVSPAW